MGHHETMHEAHRQGTLVAVPQTLGKLGALQVWLLCTVTFMVNILSLWLPNPFLMLSATQMQSPGMDMSTFLTESLHLP